ncbi:MAG: asparaginase [Rhodobacteraceae bacterium]|jgi:L-asparaginase II|nr:asparaginase [Paracoccaceae bacterium]
MSDPVPLADVWRGDILECRHFGHAVIVHADHGVIATWGNPSQVLLPRSSSKMLQALPLVESGAADAAGLTTEHLALACASHNGAAIHTERVTAWLHALGLSETDLRCGPQMPDDLAAHRHCYCGGHAPTQIHNNCSGKHTGFLTLAKHLRAGPEYIELDHPVQKAVLDSFEDMTGAASTGWAIDGCSAPNFATTVAGLAAAMARYAAATENGDARARAAHRLTQAMMAHPELVAGEGRACTELMRAMNGRAAIKTGAEGVFIAIVPERRIGVALKIADGATRGAECAVAAILVALGVLDPLHPATRKRLDVPILNRRGIETGRIVAAPGFAEGLRAL